MLDRQGIPEFLFCQGDIEALDFEDAIGTLIEFSLIAKERGQNVFEMHRLVQLATRKWHEVNGELDKKKEEVLSLLSDQFPSGNDEAWKVFEALEPHAQAILKYDYSSKSCRIQLAKIFHKSAWYAWAQGKYVTAEARTQNAGKITTELLGTDDPNTLGSHSLLALTYRYQGRWMDAEELEVQVLETSSRVLGEEHPDTLTRIANLATT